MSEIVNTEQNEVWNGPDGMHWANHCDRYDAMAMGFNADLLAAAALTQASQVLDIGCGTGQITRLAARQSPQGHALGIDLSVPMLEHARRSAGEERIGNVTFIRGDAQTHPFCRDFYDVAISRAGVMFFADPLAAFVNIQQALKRGGRLVFLTHRQASRPFEAVLAAVTEHVVAGDHLTESGVDLFSEPHRVRPLLSAAGFVGATATPVEAQSFVGRDAAEAADFLFDGPLRSILEHADSPSRRCARAAVIASIRGNEQDDAVLFPAHGWLYTARRPHSPL
ncbi:class I SAM-dependent methyltransferase [Mycobacterium neumannii]|uniref:class I SAM-dependent methyltransferase n=1 Tax=Mycobacterium neumannii TaxID=2048551 RepID=UPI003AB7BC3A